MACLGIRSPEVTYGCMKKLTRLQNTCLCTVRKSLAVAFLVITAREKNPMTMESSDDLVAWRCDTEFLIQVGRHDLTSMNP
ncbi:hypothetical protein CY34DRAFT_809642 [Suillus luteus UH-Slu-Lm8-n1]|uniref:Uncharacterized protein n=1 Tax=Suillus luteus UH-Slu-Lm8-n1 TaxID=930992 RepID=A0A0D0AUV8_9AGAM|nr:hypothetical protein CY34DRAFT_809642 [Suillus luteus UH-Slu-Lm8-n1]